MYEVLVNEIVSAKKIEKDKHYKNDYYRSTGKKFEKIENLRSFLIIFV